ncbi:MAG: hypothetical protein ACOCQA_02245 [bacterium]
MKKLDETEEEIEYIKTTVKYLLNVNEVISYENLKEKSKKIIPERSGVIMTVAEKIREKGKREGIQEGKKEELINTLKIQLEKKFKKELPEDVKKGIDNADRNKLDKIRDKIFEIKSIDEVRDIVGI